MADKKPYIFPILLFLVFFILVAIIAYFQTRITKENMETLLKGEGELIFNYISRELDVNLEYLEIIDRSPSLVTPSFLNIMAYDEEVAEEIYSLFRNASIPELKKSDISNILVVDRGGKVLWKKGDFHISVSTINRFLKGRDNALIETSSKNDSIIIIGIRTEDKAIFFGLDKGVLNGLKKRLLIKDIIEREGKRLNVTGINLYDHNHTLYISTSNGITKDVYRLMKPLQSRFLPGFSLEVLLSKEMVTDIRRRAFANLMVIFALVVISAALSIYIIFVFERRHEKRARDIEREMEMKERLISLGRLASGMAHEIKNPLNAIGISVQRLKREFLPEEEKRPEYYRFLDIVRAELMRVNKIVEDFLLSTKSQVPYAPEEVNSLIEEVILVLKEKALSKGIEMVFMSNNKVVIECQRERLKQVFYNITLNAIESTQRGGLVTISVDRTDGKAVIKVKDTGQGIKREDMQRIFEYYYTTKDKGMGLGLPISYMIVKDHGGEISVTSQDKKGTTFAISLPLRRKTKENAIS